MRTTELFHGSFSPSSAQLSTEKLAKAIPHPLPPRNGQKYGLFHTYRTAQNRNLACEGSSDLAPVRLKPQSRR